MYAYVAMLTSNHTGSYAYVAMLTSNHTDINADVVMLTSMALVVMPMLLC